MYKYIQSDPFPKDWLKEKVEMYKSNGFLEDFAKTLWGEILLKKFADEVEDGILKLKNIEKEMLKFEELEKFIKVVRNGYR